MRSPTDDGASTDRLSDVVKWLKETGARSPLRLTNEELRAEMQVLETVKRLADARDAQLLATARSTTACGMRRMLGSAASLLAATRRKLR